MWCLGSLGNWTRSQGVRVDACHCLVLVTCSAGVFQFFGLRPPSTLLSPGSPRFSPTCSKSSHHRESFPARPLGHTHFPCPLVSTGEVSPRVSPGARTRAAVLCRAVSPVHTRIQLRNPATRYVLRNKQYCWYGGCL